LMICWPKGGSILPAELSPGGAAIFTIILVPSHVVGLRLIKLLIAGCH